MRLFNLKLMTLGIGVLLLLNSCWSGAKQEEPADDISTFEAAYNHLNEHATDSLISACVIMRKFTDSTRIIVNIPRRFVVTEEYGFIEKHNLKDWYTPPLGDVLNGNYKDHYMGITRLQVIEVIQNNKDLLCDCPLPAYIKLKCDEPKAQ